MIYFELEYASLDSQAMACEDELDIMNVSLFAVKAFRLRARNAEVYKR